MGEKKRTPIPEIMFLLKGRELLLAFSDHKFVESGNLGKIDSKNLVLEYLQPISTDYSVASVELWLTP